jgi:hypothetical protein
MRIWNGTAWSEVAELNTASRDLGADLELQLLRIGGRIKFLVQVVMLNLGMVLAWTEVADLNTARIVMVGCGVIIQA